MQLQLSARMSCKCSCTYNANVSATVNVTEATAEAGRLTVFIIATINASVADAVTLTVSADCLLLQENLDAPAGSSPIFWDRWLHMVGLMARGKKRPGIPDPPPFNRVR